MFCRYVSLSKHSILSYPIASLDEILKKGTTYNWASVMYRVGLGFAIENNREYYLLNSGSVLYHVNGLDRKAQKERIF